jgi:hypothetical protein
LTVSSQKKTGRLKEEEHPKISSSLAGTDGNTYIAPAQVVVQTSYYSLATPNIMLGQHNIQVQE